MRCFIINFTMLYLTSQNFGFPTSIPRSTSSVHHRCSSTWSLLTVRWTPRPCSVLWKRRRPRRSSRRLQKCRSQWQRCGDWERKGLWWRDLVGERLGRWLCFYLKYIELSCITWKFWISLLSSLDSRFQSPSDIFRFCFFLHFFLPLAQKTGGPTHLSSFCYFCVVALKALKKSHQTRLLLWARCRCQQPWRSSWVKSPAPPRSVGRRGLGPRWLMPNHHQKRPSRVWRAVAAWEARR